ncbi:uncharacterized protein EDB93DRAFT_1180789 [Suillus bovinus]|uniref:uncharacterized protein n=1 Tax=Suillus bovinus TaxID=48563 RepID=UPI001B87FA03|nr:uncharacterized protein EDB93DRAFT_1180789 [Suillus bovinus]KAG2130178.1 hypothetical protein EDB93DRAFT_1180789 [Suillus bovinus]
MSTTTAAIYCVHPGEVCQPALSAIEEASSVRHDTSTRIIAQECLAPVHVWERINISCVVFLLSCIPVVGQQQVSIGNREARRYREVRNYIVALQGRCYSLEKGPVLRVRKQDVWKCLGSCQNRERDMKFGWKSRLAIKTRKLSVLQRGVKVGVGSETGVLTLGKYSRGYQHIVMQGIGREARACDIRLCLEFVFKTESSMKEKISLRVFSQTRGQAINEGALIVM